VPGGSLFQVLERRRFAVLFACLLTLFAVRPLLPERPDGEAPLALDAALTAVLLAALWSLKWRRSAMLGALVVMAATLAVVWMAHVAPSQATIVLALSCGLAIMGVTAGSLLWHVVREREVRADTILGGISVYLLLGAAWSLVYAALETLQPGSLVSSIGARLGAEQRGTLLVPDLLYYSVDVLTTIGPQDVHAVSGAARAWTGLEAMTGQLFLVIFISRMVSIYGASGGKG
jgi:4-hydroxybenzoate polyprenyltransferase